MSNEVDIFSLNKEKIKFLLTNHSLFTDREIKLSAKRLVYLNNNPEPTASQRGLASLQSRGYSGFSVSQLANQQQQCGSSLFGGIF